MKSSTALSPNRAPADSTPDVPGVSDQLCTACGVYVAEFIGATDRLCKVCYWNKHHATRAGA